ncbi:MAG: glucan biosynthesis protein D [Burkholderiales bacterium PBB1]|nr:MAG: glucan biosynthesis protein D [Burkholderiales bacterium PBB1]
MTSPTSAPPSRRQFITSLAALAGSAAVPAWAEKLQAIGTPQRFDYAALKGQAQALSRKPYEKPRAVLPKEIEALDWDAYQAIRFRPDHALWRDDKLRFQAQFFHLGLYFKSPVRLYELADGQAQELAYVPEMFDHGKSGLDHAKLPRDLGFAGFRLNFHTDLQRDITAFLGASYFRAVGGEWQYGLSARGLAIDTGAPKPEEFPNFTGFWLERPAVGSSSVTVYALLDSPSVAGAYRFVITPGDTQVMDIDAALYPRTSIERLGIAPCTSMFQTGENDRRMGYDWRGEIHDSDGLAMWTGSGEWIWRPLTNPRQLAFNAFQDNDPRGFGLLQRDRDFDHYQDDGVFYEKRPCLWVEPKSGWGAGSVQLVEIPTVDETFDNIVAFWNPARQPQAGDELLLGYRLYWGAQPPARPPLARCVATRTGLGGVVGKKRTYFSWRFAVDFAGGDFALIGPNAKVTAEVTASSGARIETVSARPLHAVQGYRALFDVVPTASTDPIELRLYLRCDGQPLTETWLYHWSPPPMAERTLY